jgi:hypothetical protein
MRAALDLRSQIHLHGVILYMIQLPNISPSQLRNSNALIFKNNPFCSNVSEKRANRKGPSALHFSPTG